MRAGRLLMVLEAALAMVSIAAAQGLRLALLAAVAGSAVSTTRLRYAGFAGAAVVTVAALLAMAVIGSAMPLPAADRCFPAHIASHERWSRNTCGPAAADPHRARQDPDGRDVGSR